MYVLSIILDPAGETKDCAKYCNRFIFLQKVLMRHCFNCQLEDKTNVEVNRRTVRDQLAMTPCSSHCTPA